jgi:UDP-hydrolysing UDP-N-acetyl-D-glucosamine 2-epimerase
MEAIRERPTLQLQVIAAGTMVLERFDQPVRIVRQDGFHVDGEIHIELEGSTPATMAKSVGIGVVEFSSEFQRLKPHLVVVIGDRYEALAAALAAAYMNLTIVHLQGGEISGSIDESARHAITKLAHFHLPATERARQYLLRMGERPETILGVGCPSSDLAHRLDRRLDSAVVNARGHGVFIDVREPFLLAVFHPTTTEYGGERAQMNALLEALDRIALPTLLLWPNIDAGADYISKAIRQFRTQRTVGWLRTLTNLMPEDYLRVLATTACAVGNSSSFVRDAGFFGTPVVLVGNRQNYREADVHVRRVPPDTDCIGEAIREQLDHGPYTPSMLYGDGGVAPRLAASLETLTAYIQKHLGYVPMDGEETHEWSQHRPDPDCRAAGLQPAGGEPSRSGGNGSSAGGGTRRITGSLS